jgi:hypothetical protein
MDPTIPTTPATDPAAASPLAEASVSSLDELFSRDPRGFARADRALIVAELRRQRANWTQDEAQGKKRASAKKAPGATTKTTLADLGLDDL